MSSFREYLDSISMELKDKLTFALTFHGIKPASIVTYLGSMPDFSRDEEFNALPEDWEAKTCIDFSRLGVNGAVLQRRYAYGLPSIPATEYAHVLVGATPRLLEDLTTAWFNYDAKVPDVAPSDIEPIVEEAIIGSLMGYPPTAIEAYMKRRTAMDLIKADRLVKKKFGAEVVPYLFYRCSEDNWEQEAEIAKSWAEWAAKNYPRLHKAFVETHLARTANTS